MLYIIFLKSSIEISFIPNLINKSKQLMLEVILATNRSVFHNIKNEIEAENFQKITRLSLIIILLVLIKKVLIMLAA